MVMGDGRLQAFGPRADLQRDSEFYRDAVEPVSYTHLRAHETVLDIVCRLLLEKKQGLAFLEQPLSD